MKKYFLAMILFFLLSSCVYVRAQDNNINISYQEALNQVLKNASDLKNLEDSMNYLDEKKRKTEENRNELYVYLNEPLENITGPFTQIINLSRAIINYEDQISNYDMQKKILNDTAEYALRTHLFNINNYEHEINLLKSQIELDQKNLDLLEIKYKIGMASELDLFNLKNNIAQEKNNLSSLNISLTNEKQALNKLMSRDINLDINIDFNSIPKENFDQDIDFYITSELNNSPLILIKQKELSEAEYNFDSYNDFMDEVESESINNLNKATREYNDTKKNLENKILTGYNNLKSLENSQHVLNLNLKTLEQNYNNNLIKLSSGKISQNDLEKSKLEILKTQTDIHKNINSQSKLIFALNRPYLLT